MQYEIKSLCTKIQDKCGWKRLTNLKVMWLIEKPVLQRCSRQIEWNTHWIVFSICMHGHIQFILCLECIVWNSCHTCYNYIGIIICILNIICKPLDIWLKYLTISKACVFSISPCMLFCKVIDVSNKSKLLEWKSTARSNR
jgi:hypothetical protein